MYVVRRAFRNYGQMMAPGSVVEPAAIKRFKTRLNDGHIVEVSEQNFDRWDKYFKERIGAAIQVPAKEEPVKEEPVKEEPKPAEVKPAVVKAIVK